MLGRVGVDELLLDDPVDLGVDEREVPGLDRGEGATPQVEDLLLHRGGEALALDEAHRPLVVLLLDLQRRQVAAVGEAHGPPPVVSWLISRIARIGFSRAMSRRTTPASIIRRTRSAEPTLSSVVVSDMFESPTMTCSRRYFSASACGSSRVLMIGRLRVVADDTPSQMWSARWLTQYFAPWLPVTTFPRRR